MLQPTKWGFYTDMLIGALRPALYQAHTAATEPLAPACIDAGKAIAAETREERDLIVYDNLQAEVVYALLRSADNIDGLLDYIQFAAADVKQESQPPVMPVVVPVAAALPAALTGPGISVQWSIRPEEWFANNPAICFVGKETL